MIQSSICTAFVLTQRESILVDQPHFLRAIPCLLCSYLLLCFHLWWEQHKPLMVHNSLFVTLLWSLTRNLTNTLQIHCMHWSTLMGKWPLSFNDTKMVYLPWSETSANRITIRVQTSPRSAKKNHCFPTSIAGNELEMLWAVMQDGVSWTAGVDEANSGFKWWTGSDYKPDVLVVWACLIPLHSCLTYTHWSEHELYSCEGLTVRDSISGIHWWVGVPVHMLLSSGVWLVYDVMIVDKPVHSTSTVAH